jgi:tRNA threonylcarbamoyladenosine biosynthesis protein TsaE
MIEEAIVPDHASMVAFGREFAQRLGTGDVVLLHGDLGVGKTTLTQGIADGLGVREAIQSPTFALVAEHEGVDGSGQPVRLYHLDLYRLESEAELEGIGYEQYVSPVDAISVVEWPERAGDWLPDRFWLVRIGYQASGGRKVRVERHGVVDDVR